MRHDCQKYGRMIFFFKSHCINATSQNNIMSAYSKQYIYCYFLSRCQRSWTGTITSKKWIKADCGMMNEHALENRNRSIENLILNFKDIIMLMVKFNYFLWHENIRFCFLQNIRFGFMSDRMMWGGKYDLHVKEQLSMFISIKRKEIEISTSPSLY